MPGRPGFATANCRRVGMVRTKLCRSPRLLPLPRRSSGTIANRGAARSAAAAPDQLANLDQVPVRVAHVTADLAATVDRRGQKLRSAGAPLLINYAAGGDTDVQEARGVIWIRGRHERHGRLVVVGASGDTDGDPAVRQGDNREFALKHRLAAEHFRV